MRQAKTTATSVIVVLLCFVLAVPVLTVLFSRGGAFDALAGVVEGTCTYARGQMDVRLSDTDRDDGVDWKLVPVAGISLPPGASTRWTAYAGSGATTVPEFTAGIIYIQSGKIRWVIARGGIAMEGRVCNHTDQNASGNPTHASITYNASELENSEYQPILVAIFALIPLGLMLAVGWYFVGSRIAERPSGGRRRRRG